MTTIDKFIDAADPNWDVVKAPGVASFVRREYTCGDGYPARVLVTYDDETNAATGGSAFTNYKPYGELEEYELGTRSLMAILTGIGNPFRYKRFHEAWMATNPASTSEKLLAERVNESERQIRNARITGSMSGYLADKLCIVVLGRHPMEMFGFDAWINHESKGAWPVPSKRQKVAA